MRIFSWMNTLVFGLTLFLIITIVYFTLIYFDIYSYFLSLLIVSFFFALIYILRITPLNELFFLIKHKKYMLITLSAINYIRLARKYTSKTSIINALIKQAISAIEIALDKYKLDIVQVDTWLVNKDMFNKYLRKKFGDKYIVGFSEPRKKRFSFLGLIANLASNNKKNNIKFDQFYLITIQKKPGK